ncbi:MAG: endonuclease domain-containing protein [Leptodesmis sp.]|uniref:endonuclease domain-containing protein n=1 Tax=Leptodesmis sp. TaxID=3100501 RepID=UPI003D14B40C
MNNRAAMDIAQKQHWYRIPVDSAQQVLKRYKCSLPEWLAFYQTKVFGDEAHLVKYYARVQGIQEVSRNELFPNELPGQKTHKRYYKLQLSPLQQLPQPIISRRLRRITFIPTTFEKLQQAREINDLWNDSPLEDELWMEMKRLGIDAERQESVKTPKGTYQLDFAIYCKQGKINVETDGDTYHSAKQQVLQDKRRDNDLETLGWRTLRFSTQDVREQMQAYCLPMIVENINRLGGLEQQGLILRSAYPASTTTAQQLNLFD